MLRLTLTNLWANKLRLALTAVAVVLGVAFMAGTMVLTDTMRHAFTAVVGTGNRGVDVIVQAPAAVTAKMGTTRERVPADTVEAVRAVEGVAAAAGSVQGFAQLVRRDGSVASRDGLGGATVGTNWLADEDLNPLALASGRAPANDDEVVLDRTTAEREGWALGQRVTVLAKGRPVPLTLVGTARFGDLGGMPGTSLVAVSDAAAQRLFAEPGTYDRVVVRAADGVAPGDLAPSIDRALGAHRFDVATGQADTDAKQAKLSEDLSFIDRFLLAFAGVSLFVGTFIIYNTFSILVAQRTRDLALLRALGAGRRQVLRSLVAEAVVVGVLASAAGLAVGVAVSFGLKAVLGTFGLEIPPGPTVVSPATVLAAFAVGVVVSVTSALVPALRAGRVPPLAALRDVAVDRSASSPVRRVLGVVLVVAGVGLFALAGQGAPETAGPRVGVGAAATLVGVVVLGPVVGRGIVQLLGWPLARSGVTGALARENARRAPRRTAATASALMIGVALVGFMTILAASMKASIGQGVDRSFRADYVIESGAFHDGGLNPTVAGEVAGAAGVAAVVPLRSAPVSAFGAGTAVQGTDTATVERLYDLQVTAGSVEAVGPGAVAVKQQVADEHHLVVGDTVTLTFPRTGPVPLRVAAIYQAQLNGGGRDNYLVSLPTFEANVTDQYDKRILVAMEEGTDPGTARPVLERALAPYPNAQLRDQAEFKASITSEIDRMLNLIYGLLALAVVIALMGIANTLALSIHERRRELGLLRAVGMTRGQVRRTVRGEALLIALLGAGVGAGLALAGSWAMMTALAEGSTTFVVPVGRLAAIVVLAGAAAVLTAVGPARRAARLPVLDALGCGQ